jgi:hypothetical protein
LVPASRAAAILAASARVPTSCRSPRHGPEARQTYDRALEWLKTNQQALEKNAWAADEMRRFQAEAEEVLGVKK